MPGAPGKAGRGGDTRCRTRRGRWRRSGSPTEGGAPTTPLGTPPEIPWRRCRFSGRPPDALSE
jgi:hypothetical protein